MESREKLIKAFEEFQERNQNADNFRKNFDFILENLSDISFDNVTYDTCSNGDILNISLLIAEDVILSINTLLVDPTTLVAFNIFDKKELLVSDVMSLPALKEKIVAIQNNVKESDDVVLEALRKYNRETSPEQKLKDLEKIEKVCPNFPNKKWEYNLKLRVCDYNVLMQFMGMALSYMSMPNHTPDNFLGLEWYKDKWKELREILVTQANKEDER